MRSADVCECAGISYLAGTRRKTSAFGFAGSPCSTAISHPAGKIGGHGPHFRAESLAASARAWAPPVGAGAQPTRTTALATSQNRQDIDFCMVQPPDETRGS